MSKPANYLSETQAAIMLGLKAKALRVYVCDEKKAREPYKHIRHKSITRDVVLYSKTDIEEILGS
ncbi:MAG: hypothetical protein M3Q06_10180 [Bacteroidota bacterium]|nr:hypothetical protein [Bacteroidota bacterium]